MNEGPRQNAPEQILSQWEKDFIDGHGFNHGNADLWQDVVNALNNLPWASMDIQGVQTLETYKNYVQRIAATSSTPDAYVKYVLSKSDPARMAEYDQRVAKFNADLDRIKREKDVAKVQKTQDDLAAFIRIPKAQS